MSFLARGSWLTRADCAMQFTWIVGIQVAMLIAVIGALLRVATL